jgi:hypothetical protein
LLCAQRSGATEQVTFGELQELLTQRGIEITDDRLDADLSYLRELELIDLDLWGHRSSTPGSQECSTEITSFAD